MICFPRECFTGRRPALRVAQITYSYQPIVGGADVYAALLHETFREAGHESVVYQAPRTGASGEEVRFIPPHPLARLGRAPFWVAPLGLRRLRTELAGFDALIAHYANYHRPVAWHPRTVLLSHGVWWDDAPGALRSRVKKRMTRRAFASARAVVANDTFFLREMGLEAPVGTAPHTEVAPGKWFVPNGIDTKRFCPAEEPARPAGPPVILVPRNLYRNRGVHLAVLAAERLRREGVGFSMRIAGLDGQPDYADECRALARDLGLAEEITFAGAVPWADMPDEYRRAAVTLVPTVCGEGTSLSALESIACGTPCVATEVAGLADLPALHCAPEPDAIANALRRALERRDRLARQQRQTVLAHFSLDRWRASWLGVLEMVAEVRE